MERIYIIGSVASGKSTLARRLSRRTGVRAYELDQVVYSRLPKKRKRTPAEQQALLDKIDAAGPWIIEGTYRRSCHCVLERAERIIFLDTPLAIRRRRILTRFLKQRLKLERCHYAPTFRMLRNMYAFTRSFERGRPELMAMLARYEDKVIVVSDPRELER